MEAIPFNRPFVAGKELFYIAQAVLSGHLAGDGNFTRLCNRWIEERFGAHRAMLTHSCTAALEIAAILSEVGPGDEVILPSYTFVSTANAFALRGARLRFIDIREDTLNLDERLLEGLVTEKTKVVVPVHYAGVGAEMDTILRGRTPARSARDRGRRPGRQRELPRSPARNIGPSRRLQLPRDEELHQR